MPPRRAVTGPCTGCFHTPVNTVLPCQDTFFGMPTLTDSSTGTRWPLSVAVTVLAVVSVPVIAAWPG
jgi:hypothetical protein